MKSRSGDIILDELIDYLKNSVNGLPIEEIKKRVAEDMLEFGLRLHNNYKKYDDIMEKRKIE